MLLASFRIRFPEFVSAGDVLVQACLDEAALETSAAEWGTSYDAAHGMLAAHKLGISPFGTASRLGATEQLSEQQSFSTLYERELAELRKRIIIATTVA